MFEKASRLKIRFETSKGVLSVEDLWDLPLNTGNNGATLVSIAKGLHRQIKEAEAEDFLAETPKVNEVLKLKFDLVMHVIEVRKGESEQAELGKLIKQKEERIMAIIAQREDEQLLATPLDDLKKELEDLKRKREGL